MEKRQGLNTVGLVEGLTRREQDILELLGQHLTDREIAQQLTLALSSVKWYTRQIYAKLEVEGRHEAVAKARELGLLTSSPFRPALRKNNLPNELTSFIGREREIGELRLLLHKKTTRLVTLTGSGGTGKTRLALRTAAGLLDAFTDGVWLVELAPLADPQMVPRTIIAVLGQVEQHGKDPAAQLADYLREKQALLILDNCEHLVETCAELSARLLMDAPGLIILASSREILGVPGEITYRVPPLEMPAPHHLPTLEELGQFDGVRLFVERAQSASSGFSLREENAADVARIVRRLDGIPLALELAAARLHLLSVAQIVERLNDAFRLLTGGSRTALPRHQTLTALIDWSYNLLSEEERRLLRGLSVFAGNWMLEAAEGICADKPASTLLILDTLGKLADKSLIQVVESPDGVMRYRMLETVRQYAHIRLVEAGEAQTRRKRHLEFYLNLAQRKEPQLRGREQVSTLDFWEGELDNLRLALEWALQEDVEAELSLGSALEWFWHIRGHAVEGLSWLKQGLEAEALLGRGVGLADRSDIIRAKALMVYGFLLVVRNFKNVAITLSILEEAVRLYRTHEPGQSQDLAWALLWLGRCEANRGNLSRAQVLVEESLNRFREIGYIPGMAASLDIPGKHLSDLPGLRRVFEEMLALNQSIGDTDGIATAYWMIGGTALADGDYLGARAAYQKGREHYRMVGNRWSAADNGTMSATSALLAGNLESAELDFEECQLEFENIADENGLVHCLFRKCDLYLAQGRMVEAEEMISEYNLAIKKMELAEFRNLALHHAIRLALLQGDSAKARRIAGENLSFKRDIGGYSMLVFVGLGYLALQEGDLELARTHFGAGLQALIQSGRIIRLEQLLDGFALLAVRRGRLEQAARLFGTRQWRGCENTLAPAERAERAANFGAIQAGLGETRFAQLRAEGQAMTFEQVLDLVSAQD